MFFKTMNEGSTPSASAVAYLHLDYSTNLDQKSLSRQVIVKSVYLFYLLINKTVIVIARLSNRFERCLILKIVSEVASFLIKCRSKLPSLKQMRTVYEDNRRLVKRLRRWVLLKQFKQNAFWKYKCKSYFKLHIPETGVRFSYRRPVKPLTFNRSYGIIFILKDSNSNFLIVRN